ncbi:MFS transporter [Acidisphaera sp. L21]|uniref:MFS transporter n=1 Tax=Acidisphaera sp. L21 TaxID=1641851 RepID=UPI00131D6231|nr:MFS transporter [Acidisphaera sp. L21]
MSTDLWAETGIPAATDTLLKSALDKAFWRLLPLLTLGFLFNFIDRTAVGFAALTMNQDLGLTATQFGWGAGILFIGYCALEVPSNLILYRVGARRWLARIMVTWGLAAMASAFVTGPISFYATRFLLGTFEAGFAPGVYFLLSAWFPVQQRTRMLGWFMLAIPLSTVVGGPLSGLLVQMHGTLGVKGWQWIFLLEGLPTCLIGIATWFMLTDSPASATWLSPPERAALDAQLASEHRDRPHATFSAILADPRVLVLSGITFCFTVGSYGISMWLPLILKSQGLGSGTIGLVSAIPSLFAAAGMLLWAIHTDRTGNRIGNLAMACSLGAIGLGVSYWFPTLVPGLVGVTLALIGITAARTIFFAIPSRFLTGAAAAGGLALINSVGAFGGFVGPFAVGWLKDQTGGFSIPMAALGAFLIVSVLLTLSLRLLLRED